MKNVTLSMDDDLAAWARVEAAKRGRSLSRFLADVLAERRAQAGRRNKAEETLTALEAFFNGAGFPGATEMWTGREDLYAERETDLLRGHQHTGLRGGPGGT